MSEDEDDILRSSPPSSPVNIPIRREESYERFLINEEEDRRRAPPTYYQNESSNNLLDSIPQASVRSIRNSSSLRSISTSQSFVNVAAMFNNIFREENPAVSVESSETIKSEESEKKSKSRVNQYIIDPISNTFYDIYGRFIDFIELCVKVSLALAGGGLVFSALFWIGLSIFVMVYWFWWWSVFPVMTHTVPLYFDFDSNSDGQLNFLCSTPHNREDIELPHASLQLLFAKNQWQLNQQAAKLDSNQRSTRPKTTYKKRTTRRLLTKKTKQESTKSIQKLKPTLKRKVKTSQSSKELSYEERMTQTVYDWRQDVHPEETESRFLSPGEKYDVAVKLRLRNNEVNHNLASFMVQTELITPKGKTIVSSKRPVMVNHIPSNIFYNANLFNTLALLMKIAFFPFYLMFLLGSWISNSVLFVWNYTSSSIVLKKSQKFSIEHEQGLDLIVLDVLVIEEYLEQAQFFLSVAMANITLSQPCLQLWDSSLSFEVKLEGFRFYFYYYKWTCFTTFLITVIVIEINNLFIMSTLVAANLWLTKT